MTLARYFIKLAQDADMNLHEIARKADVNPSTSWKITKGEPVRATTLGKCLRALGLKPDDPEYREAFALWGAETVGHGAGIGMATGLKAKGSAEDRLVALFTKALPEIPRAEWSRLERALSQPEAIVNWLKSRG